MPTNPQPPSGLSRESLARGSGGVGSGLGRVFLVALVLLASRSEYVWAADSAVAGSPAGQILAAGNRRVMILSTAGDVLWEHPTGLTHDVWMLPTGNVLYADGASVTEVRPDHQVVFRYQAAEQKGGGTYSCQRLAGGLTLVGENSTGRVLEVDGTGQLVFSLQTSPYESGGHQNLRMVRKLENGNYLVCQSGARRVREYTPAGAVVWEQPVSGPLAFAALRTPQGTTLVSSLDQVVEYDSHGRVVWQLGLESVPGVTFRNLTGIHLLPNGGVVLGCYRAYQDGRGCGLLEVSREKTLVWRYSQPTGDDTMMAVQLLTEAGKNREGPCLR